MTTINSTSNPTATSSSKTKKRAVVICPGRGTYNKEELGYLHRLHSDKPELISVIDNYRTQQGLMTISELDAMQQYSMRLHTAGEIAHRTTINYR